MYLIFDFETTGLFNSPAEFNKQKPIQLAWKILNNEKQQYISRMYYIKGNDKINEDFHKNLSVDFLNSNGENIAAVLIIFMRDLRIVAQNKGLIIAHNIDFDFTILLNELKSLGMYEQYKDVIDYFSTNQYCTMKHSVDYCKLPKYHKIQHKRLNKGYKYPKLIELYRILFSKDPTVTLHDATNDVSVTVDCFIKLQELGI